MSFTNKLKILNDPIYGFITIPSALIFDLIEHPYFQRLRRISQLGLTCLVYPGAYHTRFHHAIGAMHLMTKAVSILRAKGHEITKEEEEAVYIAILLHDIGHGPFSHALEKSIIPDISHEQISLSFMEVLNEEFKGKLSLGIQIFKNEYPKGFLHQLISSQLDMDRLDYLRRDSFYTGVTEGQVNSERLISMLNVHKDKIVVDAKGIYSVEKFLVARRLMYWQVYLHKTVLSAEFLLIQILKLAKQLNNKNIVLPKVLKPFIEGNIPTNKKVLIDTYAQIDDYDIMAAAKAWCTHEDVLMKDLCKRLLNRQLLGVESIPKKLDDNALKSLRQKCANQLKISEEQASYLVFTESMSNNAYNSKINSINLLYKNGGLRDIADAADQLNISALTKPVTKHFLFAPKTLLRA